MLETNLLDLPTTSRYREGDSSASQACQQPDDARHLHKRHSRERAVSSRRDGGIVVSGGTGEWEGQLKHKMTLIATELLTMRLQKALSAVLDIGSRSLISLAATF